MQACIKHLCGLLPEIKNRNSGLYSLQHRKLTDRHGILQISHSHDGNLADDLDSNQDIISPEAQSKIDDLNRRITELEAKQNRTLEATKKLYYLLLIKLEWIWQIVFI